MGNCCSSSPPDEFIQIKTPTDVSFMMTEPNSTTDALMHPLSTPAPLLQSINFAAADEYNNDTTSSDINDDEIRNLLAEEEN